MYPLLVELWLKGGESTFFGVIALVQVTLPPADARGLNWTPSRGDGDDEEPVREEQIIGALKEHEAGMPTADL